ncbi:MAG: efflux RND transporter periplasmic adaptor subunit [Anaerovorax sp.]
MGKKKKIITLIVGVVILIGASVGGYYVYQALNYFQTNNASVTADLVSIIPQMSGIVESWDVKEGDDVKKNQVLGKQDVASFINSSAINENSLAREANSILSKAEIRSPIKGKIVKSNVTKGVSANMGNTVAIVADTSNLYIKANIEETDIFKIKVGQRVRIKMDAYPGKTFTGYVEVVSPATQNAFSNGMSLNTSGTYSKVTQLIPVKISMINDENLPMLLGMNATVKISIK